MHGEAMAETSLTTVDRQGLEVLGPQECWKLIASSPVGRVAFAQEGGPMVLPVNHGLVGHRVVFRTLRGALLHEALMERPVAVDGVGPGIETQLVEIVGVRP